MSRSTRRLLGILIIVGAMLSFGCEPPSLDCWGPNGMHLWGDQSEGHFTRGSDHVIVTDPSGSIQRAQSSGGLVTVYDVNQGQTRVVTIPPDVLNQLQSAVNKEDCGRFRSWAQLESALWPASARPPTPEPTPTTGGTSSGGSSGGGDVTSSTLLPGRYKDVHVGLDGELIVGNGTYSFRNLVLTEGSRLTVLPDAHAVIYVEQEMTFNDCAVNASGQPQCLVLVPLNGPVTVESTLPAGQTVVKGAIYAPSVDVALGVRTALTGAVVGRKVTAQNATITYDKRLKGLNIPGLGTVNVISLEEQAPQ